MECPVCLEFKCFVKVLHVHGTIPARNGIAHYVCAACCDAMLAHSDALTCPICRRVQLSQRPAALPEFVVPVMLDGVLGYKTLARVNGKFVMQYPVYETPDDPQHSTEVSSSRQAEVSSSSREAEVSSSRQPEVSSSRQGDVEVCVRALGEMARCLHDVSTICSGAHNRICAIMNGPRGMEDDEADTLSSAAPRRPDVVEMATSVMRELYSFYRA
jgi:hypothetical protein